MAELIKPSSSKGSRGWKRNVAVEIVIKASLQRIILQLIKQNQKQEI